ncbi:hypothetical protein [Streptomyces sp. NBC_00057]|uniref:hypothetical protein n=1 Tax=Streptomyces sp. NBC_00057 TaxID=2975634 RepID=UPI003244B3C7
MALALAGDQPVRSGTVTLDGKPLRSGHPGEVIRAGVGLAPEERKAQALFLQQSVRAVPASVKSMVTSVPW